MKKDGVDFCPDMFIGESPQFRVILEEAKNLVGQDLNVLITGETGTGKELLARYIHSLEKDPNRPFVAINCAAIPETLFESELFGHEKGAFTGAIHQKIGLFEQANGGDILLDEITRLNTNLQAKLLRVLQEKEIKRVCGSKSIRLNFRVIAMTNRPVEELRASDNFLYDLYHRINDMTFHIPPLRERPEDIPLLADYFFKKYSSNGEVKELTSSTIYALCNYDWPGNVRELEKTIKRLVIRSKKKLIEREELPEEILKAPTKPKNGNGNGHGRIVRIKIGKGEGNLNSFTWGYQRQYIVKKLIESNWNKTMAAKKLGISAKTLYQYIRKMAIGHSISDGNPDPKAVQSLSSVDLSLDKDGFPERPYIIMKIG